MRVILHISCQINRISSSLLYVISGSCQMQCNCSFVYSSFNIRLIVCSLLLEIYRQFDERYIRHILPSAGHNIPFALCQLWFRSNRMKLQFCIFSLKYSIEYISATIRDMRTIQCMLYSTCAPNNRAHPSVYAVSPLNTVISSVNATLHM
jgi:hypothetical protein